MHAGIARTVIAIALIVLLSLGTLRNAVVLATTAATGPFGSYEIGTAAGAVVLLLGLVGAILLLRSGIRRRRADRAAHAVIEPAIDGAARRLELAREYPEERWTSLPLDEERVARWLSTRAFTEQDGSAVTADGLRRSDESERRGTVRVLEHRYGYVRVTLLSSFSRLRGVTVDLLVDDPGIRAEIAADLRSLAEDLGGLTLRAAAEEPVAATA